MGDPLPIKIFETLSNLLGMYTYPHEEVLILEAVANGMDANAKKINIKLTSVGSDYFVTFHNDGPPMTQKQFIDYHTISFSSKTKGEGIGFAGVGAKIFLASSQGSEIITITGESEKVFASKMYKNGHDIEYDTSIKKSLSYILGYQKIEHKRGTSYQVKITSKGYDFIKKNITSIIQFWFNYAILSHSIQLTINGKNIPAWEPGGQKFKKIIQIKNKKVSAYFWITDKEVPEEKRHIVYTVFGKRILASSVDFAYQIKGDMVQKIFCVVDVSLMAEHLTSNKEDFKKSFYTNTVKSIIKQAFFEFLKEQKLLVNESAEKATSKYVVNELTKKLDSILQNENFKFLNPFSVKHSRIIIIKNLDGTENIKQIKGNQPAFHEGGDGVESGEIDDPIDSPILGGGEGNGFVKSNSGKDKGQNKKSNTQGLFIINANFPDDPREAWIDPKNKALTFNSGHPFNQKFTKKDLFNYNLSRVCISALIKYRNDEIEWDSLQTLEFFENILHEVYKDIK